VLLIKVLNRRKIVCQIKRLPFSRPEMLAVKSAEIWTNVKHDWSKMSFAEIRKLNTIKKHSSLYTGWNRRVKTTGLFHQHSTSSFFARRSRKHKTVKFSVFFALLESARAKAALRTLMKLTPGSNSDGKEAFHRHVTNQLSWCDWTIRTTTH